MGKPVLRELPLAAGLRGAITVLHVMNVESREVCVVTRHAKAWYCTEPSKCSRMYVDNATGNGDNGHISSKKNMHSLEAAAGWIFGFGGASKQSFVVAETF